MLITCLFLVLVHIAVGSPNNLAEDLFLEYFKWKITELNPQVGIVLGYHSYLKGTEINNMSMDFVKNVPIKCKEFGDRALEISRLKGIGKFEIHFLKFLKAETEYCVEGFTHKGYLLPPIDYLDGVQSSWPRMFSRNFMPYKTVQDYKNALSRLSKIPQQLEEIIILLRKGVDEGITYSNKSLYRSKRQFEMLQVKDPTESEFYQKFDQMASLVKNAPLGVVTKIQNDAKRIIGDMILPSYKKLQDYVFGEYQHHLRDTAGVFGFLNSKKMYNFIVKFFTTINISPEEIHQIGLDGVKELRKKTLKAAREQGYADDITFEELVKKLKSDENQYFNQSAQLMDYFRDQMKKIEKRLSKVFSKRVLSDEIYSLEAQAVPPGGGGFAYYIPGSLDKTRKGTFFINTENPRALKKFEVLSLTLHEGNPGHHLQLTTTANDQFAPLFVKQTVGYWAISSGTPAYNSFIEGWALYAEYLGHEMGLYDDEPIQIFGFYSFNLLRSARLVVDTGLHAFGWSREKAVDYLAENTFLSKDVCEAEIDRYSLWPGQALSYKIGEMEIKKFRTEQELEAKEKHQKFSVQEFHEGLMRCDGPLGLLRSCFNLQAETISKRSDHKSHSSKNYPTSFLLISCYILKGVFVY